MDANVATSSTRMMGTLIVVLPLIGALLGCFFYAILRSARTLQDRLLFILSYSFPGDVLEAFAKVMGLTDPDDVQRVVSAARQFFRAQATQTGFFSAGFEIGLPSRAVDMLWREFMRSGPAYWEFCIKSFGNHLPHVPAEFVPTGSTASRAVENAWWVTCKDEAIDPNNADHMPFLFAIDDMLRLPGAFALTGVSFRFPIQDPDDTVFGA